MVNIEFAKNILKQLKQNGVKTICICPGARNAPFVELLEDTSDFEVLSFFDERSAGFFALGRAQRDQCPVVVATTSGTAVSELLSPVIEAYYSCVPLVVLSADRPKRLRGTGAPQAIEQSHMFKNYVEDAVDLEVKDSFQFLFSGRQPQHINVCFDEPLIDGDVSKHLDVEENEWKPIVTPSIELPVDVLEKCVIVVGRLLEEERSSVEAALTNVKAPIFVEASSGLRGSELLQDKLLLGGEQIVSQLLKTGEIHSVLRIGDVPLGRYWRDIDQLNLKTLSLTSKPWSGTDKSQVYQMDLANIDLGNLSFPQWDYRAWIAKGREVSASIKDLCVEYSRSEAAFFDHINQEVDRFDSVYIGNSLPIRLWDLVNQNRCHFSANRGANGIDGQLSTAIGLMQPDSTNLVVLGDLTALYDFSGLWLTNYLKEKNINVQFVIVNNGGGQIFARIFKNPLFRNEHELSFEKFGAMWGWEHLASYEANEINFKNNLCVQEWLPDPEHTQRFWEKYNQLWKI